MAHCGGHPFPLTVASAVTSSSSQPPRLGVCHNSIAAVACFELIRHQKMATHTKRSVYVRAGLILLARRIGSSRTDSANREEGAATK